MRLVLCLLMALSGPAWARDESVCSGGVVVPPWPAGVATFKWYADSAVEANPPANSGADASAPSQNREVLSRNGGANPPLHMPANPPPVSHRVLPPPSETGGGGGVGVNPPLVMLGEPTPPTQRAPSAAAGGGGGILPPWPKGTLGVDPKRLPQRTSFPRSGGGGVNPPLSPTGLPLPTSLSPARSSGGGGGVAPPLAVPGQPAPIVSPPRTPPAPPSGAPTSELRVVVVHTPAGRVVAVRAVAPGEVLRLVAEEPLVLRVVGSELQDVALPAGSRVTLTAL